MKMRFIGFLFAGFSLMFLLPPSPVKAESINEISFPSISPMNLAEANSDILGFNPVRAALSRKEAETFLSQLGITVNKKPRVKTWDPFKAVRILQTSA